MKKLKAVKYTYSVFACALIAFGLTVLCRAGVPEHAFMLAGGVLMIGFGIVRILGYFSKDILQLAFQFDLILGIASAVLGCYMIWDPRAAGAALGSMLSIKPVLRIQSGKLDAYRKVRGMRSAMQAMIEGLREDTLRLEGERFFIRAAYAGDRQAGESWQAALQAAFPEYEVGLDPLPISVCCHVGCGALGVGIARDILAEAEEK